MIEMFRHKGSSGLFSLLFLFFFVLTGDLQGQELSIKGSLKKEGSAFREGKVLLYKRNELVAWTEPNWLGKFTFDLALDSLYTIEVKAGGHIPKRVIFDTRIPEDVDEDVDPSTFDFDVVMLEEERVPKDKDGIFDFPVGRVFFDPYKKEFRFNVSYTARMRREFRKVLNKDKKNVRTEETDTLKVEKEGGS